MPAKNHKLYEDIEIVKAAKALAELNKREGRKYTSFSALVGNEIRKMIRVHSARLRKAGVKIPDSILGDQG